MIRHWKEHLYFTPSGGEAQERFGENRAAALFAEIPQYARDQIMTRSRNVNTLDGLEGYVNNLLRGDD